MRSRGLIAGTADRLPTVVSGVGAFLALLMVAEVLLAVTGGDPTYDGFRIGVLTSTPFIVGLMYGGYWLRKSDISREQFDRIGRWWLIGLFGTTVLILGVTVAWRRIPLVQVVGTIRWAGSIGGVLGLVMGTFHARAIQQAIQTERARIAEERAQQERDRLAEFASIVSHDLRNPLNVAEGYLDLIDDETESPYVENVSTALDRMYEIIDDTLTLARAGKSVGETEPVALAELAHTCWETVDTGNGSLRIERSTTVEADVDRLRHVFENLFRNALEHGGADVTVRLGVLEDGSGFYVADDGPGIPASDREEVFESGYTTASEGTGFGLSIVKTIVEAHGWTIAVTESKSGGARFEVRGIDRVTTPAIDRRG